MGIRVQLLVMVQLIIGALVTLIQCILTTAKGHADGTASENIGESIVLATFVSQNSSQTNSLGKASMYFPQAVLPCTSTKTRAP